MSETWAKWESLVINGVFPLRRFLSRSNHSVIFLTENKAHGFSEAAIKLIPAHPTRSEAQLSHWRTVADFSHPRLIRLFDSGSCQIAGHPFLFVVMEYAEQTLAQILPHRPLDPGEVRDLLSPTLDALAFIHDKGLVHRKLKPPNFLVVNDQLKLSSDTLQPAGDARPGAKLTVYDPPEAKDGRVSAPADIWALGITLVEALTQHPPAWPDRRSDTLSLPADLPSPLDDTIRRCLNHNPAARPTILELKGPTESPTSPTTSTAAQPVEPTMEDPRTPPAEAPKRPVSLTVIAILALLLAAVWGGSRLLHSHRSAQLSVAPASDLPSHAAAPTAGPISSAAAPVSTPGAVLHQVIPEISHGTRATIRGRIKVTVLLTVDQSGRVTKTTLQNGASSRYFDRLATEAGSQWQFTQANGSGPRKWLLHFEFTRDGATGYADGPQS
jgi:eukaryotic-like serine/threonine-protein kinase